MDWILVEGEPGAMHHYVLCGLKVESDLAFPELTPWDGPSEHPFDIEFRLGPVQPLWDPDAKGVLFEASGPDKIVFQVEKAGRILIENGRRVVFDAFPAADDDRVRIEFIGTTQSMLWYQRGYLPLHASALLVGERAIAVGARSHSGKSVIAAALNKLGCPLVADDMMVVDLSGQLPMVLPGYQKLRLWQDACEQLDLVGNIIANAHFRPGKFVLATTAASAHVPVPLTDIFILSGERQDTLDAEPLGRVQSVQYLLAATHMFDAVRAMGRQEQVFSGINAVAANVRVWRATAQEGIEHALEDADSILALARS
jgi:hypothetical protein